MSSRQSMLSGTDYRSSNLSPADIIRNCIMQALESSAADDLLKTLASSEWTKEYALCRVGEILQEHLKPMADRIGKEGLLPCKSCKEKDLIIETIKQQADSRANSNGVLNASNKTLSKQLEEAVFTKTTLDHQNSKLKEELASYTETLTFLKKDRHKLEVEVSQLQKKLMEVTSKCTKLTENNEKANMEKDQVQNESEKIEKLYKNERRKAANLERELEQIQYTHSQLVKTSSSEVSALKDHINLLKADNLALQAQVGNLSAELCSKVDDEKKETHRISKKLRELECQFDGLKVINDTLEKKVEFYKTQLITVGNSNASLAIDKDMLQDDHKRLLSNPEDSGSPYNRIVKANPFESFSSFNNKKVRELNLDIRDSTGEEFSEVKKPAGKGEAEILRSQNQRLRMKLSAMLMQVRHLHELLKVEIKSNKQEIATMKTILFKGFETLSHKVRMGFRRTRILGGKENIHPGDRLSNERESSSFVPYSDARKGCIETVITKKSCSRSPGFTTDQTNPSYHDAGLKRLGISPRRNRGLQEIAGVSPSRSLKKMHFYGKPESEEIVTQEFRLNSPNKSQRGLPTQYGKHVGDPGIERLEGNVQARVGSVSRRKARWEEASDDIMYRLHHRQC